MSPGLRRMVQFPAATGLDRDMAATEAELRLSRRSSGLGLGLACAWLVCASASADGAAERVQRDLVFGQASPFALPAGVIERTNSPLRGAAVRARLDEAASAGSDPRRGLDLAGERFELFVPEGVPPPAGFGLLVFVPPWEGQGLPADWLPALQRHGFAMVTAERSGNAQDVGGRRIPLALHALWNVRERHAIDPGRVYAAGFSGGSRVALRLALAWPDLFRGALLNAGSDPIGTPELPLPSAELFARFERDSRLVYLSGTRDATALAADRASRRSAGALCMSGTRILTIAGGGHEPADARAFEDALQELEAPRIEADDITACRERRVRSIARETAVIEQLVAAGHLERARRALRGFDARWGGLTGDTSRGLDASIDVHAADVAKGR